MITSTIFASDSRENSLLQFVNLDHDYIRDLEREYKQQMDEAISLGVDNFIYVNPKLKFLADMALLREQYEQVNNAWLRAFMEKAQASVQATNVLFGNPQLPSYSATAHDREIKPVIEDMMQKVQQYVDQFNEVYQRYNWLLVYDLEHNKFILIDTVAPEYNQLLQQFAPNYVIPQPSRRTSTTKAPSRSTSPRRATSYLNTPLISNRPSLYLRSQQGPRILPPD